MKLKTGILVLILFIGLIVFPNSVFAQDNTVSAPENVLYSNLPTIMDSCSLSPQLKGGGGGGGGGKGGSSSSSSKSSSSSSKKVKDGDDDTDGNSTNSSSSGMSWITLVLLIIFIPLGIVLLRGLYCGVENKSFMIIKGNSYEHNI
jgi:hypothetical protein